MTSAISPSWMRSTTFGEPSPTFLRTSSTRTPMPRIACAVPAVATIRKPRSSRREAIA
jgi:hypothetical protein